MFAVRRSIHRQAHTLSRQPKRNFITFYDGAICYFGAFILVREKYAVLIHRFQKYDRLLKPGLNFKIPFIDDIAYIHDLREQAVDISSQVAVTKDNVALHIDAVLFLQVEDPYKASYGVENIGDAITNLAQTTMRSEIGKLALDKTFEERELLNHSIVESIDAETQDWGTRCIRYEIKDIEPPEAIQKSMTLQAEAERKKRATILISEGDMKSKINISEADMTSKKLIAEGIATAMIKKANASAEAIGSISKSLSNSNGNIAAKMIMAERYISAYKKLGRKENTLLMNADPSSAKKNVNNAFEILENGSEVKK